MSCLRAGLIVCGLLFWAAAGYGAEDPVPASGESPPQSAKSQRMSAMDLARIDAWGVTLNCRQRLGQLTSEQAPALHKWLQAFDAASAGILAGAPPSSWPPIDLDALVWKNPLFWDAYFEVYPGDHLWTLMQASLVASQGQLDRARVLMVLAGQHPVPDGIRQLTFDFVQDWNRARRPADDVVALGVARHDAGDFDAAITRYEIALELWPQCALAHYERALTRRTQRTLAPDFDGKVITSEEEQAGIDLARKLNPVQRVAYQGLINAQEGKLQPDELARRITAPGELEEAWGAIMGSPKQPVDDALIARFAAACVAVECYELALASESVLVSRRGGYAPADKIVLETSLQGLAPGEVIDGVLARLTGKERLNVVRPSAIQTSPSGQQPATQAAPSQTPPEPASGAPVTPRAAPPTEPASEEVPPALPDPEREAPTETPATTK